MKALGGASAVPTMPLEGSKNDFRFEPLRSPFDLLFERRGVRQLWNIRRAGCAVLEFRDCLVSLRRNHVGSCNILQLAKIARPVVSHQSLQQSIGYNRWNAIAIHGAANHLVK